jgi:hypothetical protein
MDKGDGTETESLMLPSWWSEFRRSGRMAVMTQAVAPSFAPDTLDLDSVQHIVLHGMSWEFYENLLKEIGDRPMRTTFDNGSLEIMSPLPELHRPRADLRVAGRAGNLAVGRPEARLPAPGPGPVRDAKTQQGLSLYGAGTIAAIHRVDA